MSEVRKEVLEGEHSAYCTTALLNRVPRAARASMFVVMMVSLGENG